MIQGFDTNNNNFQISIDGSFEDCIYTIHALLDSITYVAQDMCDQTTRYHICNMIKALLPTPQLIESVEGIKQLRHEKKILEYEVNHLKAMISHKDRELTFQRSQVNFEKEILNKFIEKTFKKKIVKKQQI